MNIDLGYFEAWVASERRKTIKALSERMRVRDMRRKDPDLLRILKHEAEECALCGVTESSCSASSVTTAFTPTTNTSHARSLLICAPAAPM